MKYFIHFDTNMSENYEYWLPLFNRFLSDANMVRIDCWNTEIQVIEYIKQLYKEIISVDIESNLNMTIFMINKSDIAIEYLLSDCFNSNNLLKYFHLSLWQDNVELISSEHYGNECTICNIDYHEIEIFRGYIPKSSSIIVHDEKGVVYKEKK